MKHITAFLLATIVVFSFQSCTKYTPDTRVAVLLPSDNLERWGYDKTYLTKAFSKYTGMSQYTYVAEDEDAQVGQIESVLKEGFINLVVTPIDYEKINKSGLLEKYSNLNVVCHSRIIFDNAKITHFSSCDVEEIGTLQGQYLIQYFQGSEKETMAIELFAGPNNDHNSSHIFTGAYNVLKPYIDNGSFVVRSGKDSFEKVALPEWSRTAAYDDRNFITSTKDFATAFNRFALCAAKYPKVKVLAFSIEDSHPHALLYGEYAGCLQFKKEYEQLTVRYIVATRGSLDGVFFELEMMEINNEDYLRNTAAYVIVQPTKDGKQVMPYYYPWETGSLYFKPKNLPQIWLFDENGHLRQSTTFGTLTVREQLSISHSKQPVPPEWIVCNNLILPSNYIEVEMYEAIFRTCNRFRTFLSAGRKQLQVVEEGMAHTRGIVLNDLEARSLVKETAFKLFGRKDLRSLSPDFHDLPPSRERDQKICELVCSPFAKEGNTTNSHSGIEDVRSSGYPIKTTVGKQRWSSYHCLKGVSVCLSDKPTKGRPSRWT